ncbi:MAG: HAD family hydrolase [Rhizobiaceae bacterium]|nr:HAD family hydrolase [Rhizobiaceae bacterium]MCV0405663.1 HAD family hydrolase [Rhizobiaceae bacterium]
MQGIELVILDCDGVLVDSEIVAARAEAELLTGVGYAIEPEELAERFAGLTTKDMLLAVEEEAGIPLQASLLERMREATDRRLAREVKAIEGAREAIARLRLPCCVCSNSRTERIELMLNRTGLLPLVAGRIFSASASEEIRPKPAPDVFLHAAREMKVEPARCMVVEDSRHGVAAARAAGMRVIGFTGASHAWPGLADLLTETGAETVIGRWSDFGPVLEALSDWSPIE